MVLLVALLVAAMTLHEPPPNGRIGTGPSPAVPTVGTVVNRPAPSAGACAGGGADDE